MPRFAVYANKAASRDRIPYLLDIQSDLLEGLATRVVVPLYRSAAFPGKTMTRLTPVFEIGGESLLMMTPELAGIARKQLGEITVSLADKRFEIIQALDMLVAGV